MKRAGRVCPTPGCTNIIFGSQRYCEDCMKIINRDINQRRSPADKKLYGAEWRKIRAEFLKNNPRCNECGALSTEVDHKIPLRSGGTNDFSNLEAKCKKHHSSKTAKFDGGFGNPVKGRGVENQ